MNPNLSKIQKYNTKINSLKEKLATEVTNLPDNPNIKRLNTSAFTISSYQIFKNNPHLNMSAFFHDFKAQYRTIASIIRKSKDANIIKILEIIIKTGRYNKHTYHPTVIKNIAELIKVSDK